MAVAPSARIDVGEHTIAYRSTGRGPALGLLHGFLCDSRVWQGELETLSDQFKVVAWDAPGAGESRDPPDPFTITDWAAALAAFLDAIGIERAHILGLVGRPPVAATRRLRSTLTPKTSSGSDPSDQTDAEPPRRAGARSTRRQPSSELERITAGRDR